MLGVGIGIGLPFLGQAGGFVPDLIDNLLLESGEALMLESGDLILLESA